MARKKSWVSLLKRIFNLDTSKQEKKEKKKRWFFQRLKIKRLASLAPPSPLEERTLSEAEEEQIKHSLSVAIASAADEEQSKHALSVAIASTAAAEAAADAHIAAEVFQLTSTPQSTHQYEEKTQQIAAIKIQTAFRGYLARKALRALKGLVKLQAIIRGRAVRRQAISTLKSLQSIVNIQSQVCARRIEMVNETCDCNENKQLHKLRDEVIKIESNSLKRWDDSILSREEATALFLSKKEAMMKRERIKVYSRSYRKPTESEQNKVNGKWRYWLEQWVDTHVAKREEREDLDPVFPLIARPSPEFGGKQLKHRNFQRHYNEGLVSPIAVPRRSFHHRRQMSIGDENSHSGSPIVPTYMAATESAKAKTRSMSSPKLRPGSFDSYSDSNSPFKDKLSLVSSITSDVTSICKMSKPDGHQQRSPNLKSRPGQKKSSRTLKDLSFYSECPLLN